MEHRSIYDKMVEVGRAHYFDYYFSDRPKITPEEAFDNTVEFINTIGKEIGGVNPFGLGIDETRRILAQMYHPSTCIQVLSLAGKGDTGELRMGAVALQYRCRIQIGYVGSEGSRDPLDRTALFADGTLGIQIIHILGPVLDR